MQALSLDVYAVLPCPLMSMLSSEVQNVSGRISSEAEHSPFEGHNTSQMAGTPFLSSLRELLTTFH